MRGNSGGVRARGAFALAVVLAATAACGSNQPKPTSQVVVESPLPSASPTAPSVTPGAPAPTVTPTPWPQVPAPSAVYLGDSFPGPTDRLAVVDHSGLFLNAAPTSESAPPSSGPGAQTTEIYVRRTDDPTSVVISWWNVGRYCHTGPVLTIERVGDELRFTLDLGPVVTSACLLVVHHAEALIRFRSSVASLQLVAEFAPERTPIPTSPG